MVSEMKAFVSYANAHQRMISAQHDLSNMANEMTHSVYVIGLIHKAAMTAWI